jgi:hypothetical protein
MPSFVPCKQCPNQCEPVFDRVVVSNVIKGATKVMWELLPSFTDPNPLTFQLQVGQTANNDADDWADVGGPVENSYFAFDTEQRVFGKTNWTYYRVLVTSSLGTYTSMPTGGLGTLSQRDWLKAKNLIRRMKTQYRLGEGQEGYLLKRRVTGQKCRQCLDFQTQEVRDPMCPSCFSTGFECGYFYPMACVWANITPKSRRIQLDGDRATVNDIVVQAKMILVELMGEDDVWVNKVTDDRYYVHKIDHTVEVRGVPVFGNVELRPIAYSSVIYDIEIPAQLDALGLTQEDV